MPPLPTLCETIWELPPLILHPFSEGIAPATLLESSKASLMLCGLIPSDRDPDELQRRILAGRISEARMLFFLGKDVFRWIDQSMEWAERVQELKGLTLRRQSFAKLLTTTPPAAVQEKLLRWGVTDHASIFSRAIGLRVLLANPPDPGALTAEFLHNYGRYADTLYRCYMEREPYSAIGSANFRFELYASGEYARILESQWS